MRVAGRFLSLCAAVCVVACFWIAAEAIWADSKTRPPSSDALLESLNADLLDELDQELFAPKNDLRDPGDVRTGQAPVVNEAGGHGDPRLSRELGPAAISENDNPLLEIGRQMRNVEGLVRQAESGPKTQRLQEQIISDLDELIKKARSSCQQGRPSQDRSAVAPRQAVPQPPKKPGTAPGKPNPKPATQSNAQPGNAGAQRPDMDAMKELIKRVWGELPAAQREQMLEWVGEEFLPKYEWLIEQYYKRLAEAPNATNN